jgi:hypothetical protein
MRYLAAALLLVGFGLGDAAIVAWNASLVSFGQVAATAVSFVLVGAGTFFTVWQMTR